MPRTSRSTVAMVSRVVAAVACVGLALPAPAAAFSLPKVAGFGGMLQRFRNGGVRGQSRTQCTASAADVKEKYVKVCEKLRTISYLEGCSGLMGWDELVMMQPGSAESRGNQKAALASVLHHAKVDKDLGAMLESIWPHRDDLGEFGSANVREAKKRFDQNSRMSAELASKAALLESKAYGAWVSARENNDYPSYAPILGEMLALQKEIISLTDPGKALYDAAVDKFDPGMSEARLVDIFAKVKADLAPLIKQVAAKVKANPSLNEVKAPLRGGPDWVPSQQAAMCKEIAGAIGFDFKLGRMDVSVHPFTGGSHPTDVRITTRYSEENWIEGVAGTIHECGHAMYEQGRSKEHMDLPVSEALGMAVHESQSLLWERMVGQSLAFWEWATPIVHKYFPHTKSCTAQDMYHAVNMVEPSLIRVDADEVTYPLHVILRFEIERDLFSGKVSVDDLPTVWNARMEEYLGIVPGSDKEGVLQDVHWSGGAFGYFPSYSLGAMMATQLFDQAKEEMPSLEADIRKGEFAPLKKWLNEKVHDKGSMPGSADALLEAVTNKPLDPSIFMKYLTDKYTTMYSL
mmetsp:Transcript_8164/g.19886  ORF Transcript_8164/g.19886 Transcript_8164/m.19886 type:complete len:574 (+) Transcript_8164:16-1737(+)